MVAPGFSAHGTPLYRWFLSAAGAWPIGVALDPPNPQSGCSRIRRHCRRRGSCLSTGSLRNLPIRPREERHATDQTIALALAALGALAPAGSAQFFDEAGLLELLEHARDLAHGDPHLVVAAGQIIAPRGKDADPEPGQRSDPRLLHHQGTGEPACILDDHGAHAVGDDAVEESPEAGPCVDGGPRRSRLRRRTPRRR